MYMNEIKIIIQIARARTYWTDPWGRGWNCVRTCNGWWSCDNFFKKNWVEKSQDNTVEPRFNGLPFNDIPGLTINIRFHGKSYSKMYGAELKFNDFGLMIFPVER